MVIEDSKNVSAKLSLLCFIILMFLFQVKQHDTADAFKEETEANEAKAK